MGYLVSMTTRVERDLAWFFEEINGENSAAARKWYVGLKSAILSLEELPNRCPPAREDPRLRNLLYGRKPHVYRVIFRVIEKEQRVEVLHVRHGARRAFKKTELK